MWSPICIVLFLGVISDAAELQISGKSATVTDNDGIVYTFEQDDESSGVCAYIFDEVDGQDDGGGFVEIEDCDGELSGDVHVGSRTFAMGFPDGATLESVLGGDAVDLSLSVEEAVFNDAQGEREAGQRRKRGGEPLEYEPDCPAVSASVLRGPIQIKTDVIADHLMRRHYGSDARIKAKVTALLAESNRYFADRSFPAKYVFTIASIKVLPSMPAALATHYNGRRNVDLDKLAEALEVNYGKGLPNSRIQHVAYFSGLLPNEMNAKFRDVEGVASYGAMCTDQSVSITLVNPRQEVNPGVTLAHEVGHSLGLTHDGKNGPGCPEEPSVIMAAAGPSEQLVFSRCSAKQARAWVGCFGCLIGTDGTPPGEGGEAGGDQPWEEDDPCEDPYFDDRYGECEYEDEY